MTRKGFLAACLGFLGLLKVAPDEPIKRPWSVTFDEPQNQIIVRDIRLSEMSEDDFIAFEQTFRFMAGRVRNGTVWRV